MGSCSQLALTLDASYPTRSLDFLRRKANAFNYEASQAPVNQAKVLLDVVIVGAGLGGLATAVALARQGHHVIILEQAHALAEVGAGIQIPSNSSRILLKWGLGPLIKGRAVEPRGMTFRRWENGEPIGYTKLIPEFQDNFGAPYYVIHRADFHGALHKLAQQYGVRLEVSCKVSSYDAKEGSVTTLDGRTFSGDLVIGADGLKSLARSEILGNSDQGPVKTGFAAYRSTVDTKLMRDDPDISWLLKEPALNIWIGDGCHVMTYTIAGGDSFNLVLSHVDNSDPATWSQNSSIDNMRNDFVGWDPRLLKIISMVTSTMKWPLLTGRRLERWVSPTGKLLILGDAAHAMVPYMSQGAAMAVEDGAALAEALRLIDTREQIPQALEIFEGVRLKRSSMMQEASLLNGKLWHFADGPNQEARDACMKPEVEGKHFLSSPNQWSDPVTQWWAYGYQAEEEIFKAWQCKQENS
ncbi:hypothetical protein BKA65DRAFT_205867 [Rhexocercosporidium sp. MPI-PUGE-AT-0058]|nr:hypothetical protein BKA65DRAFT_205867 [Rhexocercosporidium sp. MPI-PUGE-AT-0058]